MHKRDTIMLTLEQGMWLNVSMVYLKSRFRCLSRKLGTATTTASNIIVACVILHNICIKYKIDLDFDQDESQFQPDTVDAEVFVDGGNGFNIRNSFINRHFN